MSKMYKCNDCFKGCRIEVEIPPYYCLHDGRQVNWQEVKEEKETVTDCNHSVQPTTNSSQSPKLTAEVFDRPDCPEWAMYAAVDFSGNAYFYKDLPRQGAIKPHWVGGEPKQYIGNYAWMDWENSLVKRPEPEFPEWCQKGKWVCVYDRFKKEWEYFKVNETKRNCISSDNGLEYSFCDLKQARLRPYNAEEMRGLMGKVVEIDGFAELVGSYSPIINEVRLSVGRWLTADQMLRYTINGSPCGVLEHLENGAWIE